MCSLASTRHAPSALFSPWRGPSRAWPVTWSSSFGGAVWFQSVRSPDAGSIACEPSTTSSTASSSSRSTAVLQIPVPVENRYAHLLDRENLWVYAGPDGSEPFLRLSKLGLFRVSPAGELTEVQVSDAPLSVSPSGRFALHLGPLSLKHREGRRLLEFRGTATAKAELPLVRYAGERPTFVQWTLDESRLAFLTEATRASVPHLFTIRVGERHARAVSLPGQRPSGFAWVRADSWN